MALKTRLRKTAMAAATMAAVVGCSHAVATQREAVARVDAGTALNARSGIYRVADATVTLEKVVSLPRGQIGLRFSFVSDSPNCCSLFPRLGLASGPSGVPPSPSTTVVILRSDIASDGTLEMRLSEGGRSTVPFTIDFRQLGAQLP
jgi:hypothetical protein